MSTLYKIMIIAIALNTRYALAQYSEDSAAKTAVALRPVIIESSSKNSRTGPIYSENLELAKVSNVLDAIIKLRPAMLSRETGICTSEDSLSLYVNGIRHFNMSKAPQIASTDSTASDDIWAKTGKALDSSPMGFRPNRKVSTSGRQTNIDWVKAELSTIHSSDVKSIHYVPCDGWSREIGIKNVIWIELK